MTRLITTVGNRDISVLSVLTPGLKYPELVRGLVGAWSPCLTPERGLRLPDFSGRHNHGTLTAMDPATDWVLSEGRWTLDFDGSNDRVLIPSSLGITASVSVSGWVKVADTSESGAFIEIGQGNTNGFGLGVGVGNWDTDANSLLGLYSGVRWIPTSTDIGTGWHHVGMIVPTNTTNPRIYLDGRSLGTFNGTAWIAPTTEINIGGYEDGATQRFANHQSDDWLIYKRELSDTEFAQLYSLGRGGWAELEQSTTKYFYLSRGPELSSSSASSTSSSSSSSSPSSSSTSSSSSSSSPSSVSSTSSSSSSSSSSPSSVSSLSSISSLSSLSSSPSSSPSSLSSSSSSSSSSPSSLSSSSSPSSSSSSPSSLSSSSSSSSSNSSSLSISSSSSSSAFFLDVLNLTTYITLEVPYTVER